MKFLKYSLLIIISIFSFYLSDKVILFVENQSPIMKQIKKESKKASTLPVNAIIKGNTIIPGISGKKINERESYLKMNDFSSFNEAFYVYDTIKPDISLYDNLDKIIIKGNSNKKIAILSSNNEIVSFLKNSEIKVTKIIKNELEIDESLENINGVSNTDDFNDINIYLKRKKLNKKICLVGYSNIKECKKLSYFMVDANKKITRSNLVMSKMNLTGGDIILLSDNLDKESVNVIINKIKYLDLEIVYLSELIKE